MVHDVAVIGLGGMGSAIAAHCAARGAAVVGVEQFERGHDLGSSAGKSRLIRKAYFEEPAYVPLLHRTYELWRKLEREAGVEILQITGILSVGDEGSEIINGTRRAAREHGLPLEVLSQDEVRSRYPTLRLLPDEMAVFEPDGGVLRPERAIDAHLRIAEANGAELRFGVGINGWTPTDDGGVEVRLTDGSDIRARTLVLAMGPWFKRTLDSLGVPIRVQRNVQVWFSSNTDAYTAGRFPGFLLNRRGLPAPLYGFPDFGDGVKAAFHGFGDITEAEHLDRNIDTARDVDPIARAMDEWMPGAAATFREAKACMYTLTPDAHFVVDRHPAHRNVILCGGFSGHGFKFAPVIGEIGADLALNGGTRHPIDFLSLRRFSASAEA
jgi:sarcosine oxidase